LPEPALLTIENGDFVRRVLGSVKKPLVRATEVEDIAAQCEHSHAICFANEDGMFVVQLRPHGRELELFVLAAVAFKHGAVERQDAAVLKIARDLEAMTVAFESRRRGWARRLGPEWFRRGTREFVRDV